MATSVVTATGTGAPPIAAVTTTLLQLGDASDWQDEEVTEEEFFPPENFALVSKGVYRSAFPKKKNFSFLRKLGLKTILTLVLEDYPDQNIKFLSEAGIRFLQFGVPGNKEPFVDIPEDRIRDALTAILDMRNHPILIHCNKGKHRTGCLIGCLRKFQRWSHTSIFDEYRTFSHPKARSMDQQFIELFDPLKVVYDEEYLPDWPEIEDLVVAARKKRQRQLLLQQTQKDQEKEEQEQPEGPHIVIEYK